MKGTSRNTDGDASERYWRIRTTFEFLKLGAWIIWHALRGGGFGPL